MSMSLFHPTALVKVAAVRVKLEVAVRPSRSISGTRNSTTSFAAEMTTWDPAMPYQLPASNHSTSAFPEPATCRASWRSARRLARTESGFWSPRKAWPALATVSKPSARCTAAALWMSSMRTRP
ncbi:MAG: hypothetical protein INH41_26695 [Myxococcaceae bacterium]|nr:hypothetical protein [Myxococcaceae bacterium]